MAATLVARPQPGDAVSSSADCPEARSVAAQETEIGTAKDTTYGGIPSIPPADARRFGAAGRHFLFVCKRSSYPTIEEHLIQGRTGALTKRAKHGRQRFTHTYRCDT